MNRVHLIRHGKPAAAWGDDDADPGLDETGRAQARAVAETLMALPPAERPTFVVSSPLKRCQETASPLAEALGVPVLIDPAVGEIPTPAGLTQAQRPDWLRKAMAGDWSGIKGDIDYGQWRAAVARSVASHANGAVFSHFVAINGVVSLVRGDDRVIVFRPDHTSHTTLDVGEAGLSLVRLGPEAVTTVT